MLATVLALIPSSLKRYLLIAGGIGLAIVGAYLKGHFDGDTAGARRIQAQYDAYKVQVQRDIAAEVARQKTEGEDALKALQIQLDAAELSAQQAQADIVEFQRRIASAPIVPGRGATKEDVDALNK